MTNHKIDKETTEHVGNIVISGISGRFPQSRNTDEFAENLLRGCDLITEDNQNFAPGIHGLPARHGKLDNLDKFDATFFGVHAKQAHRMDPQLRMLLELTYEAIMDAGVNPATIRGSKTGVFIAVSNSESAEYWSSSEPDKLNGYGLTGCHMAMLANRISYAFDFRGPSMALHAACSSSLTALIEAVSAIKTGQCDGAIVGGAQLTLNPTNSLQIQRLGLLSPDGKCKSFDAQANGYARSEAAVVLYIRKGSDALRAYATILNAKAQSNGYKDGGTMVPSGAALKRVLEETYSEVGLNPNQIDYLECDGAGTSAGDCEELGAVAEFFCNGRTKPLPIGSVKSNMGNAEAAAGMCQIAKVLIAIQRGVIPANLHYQKPNPDVPELVDGRLEVVTKNLPWNGGLIGINSLSFSGVSAHLILRSNPVMEPGSLSRDSAALPWLVPFSGRTREAVQDALARISAWKGDEAIALLQNVALETVPGHPFSGYSIIHQCGKVAIDIQETPKRVTKRPVWFIFSGMGSQWDGMGRDLLKFKAFEASIRKSTQILAPFGLDLFELMLSNETKVAPLIKSAVAITAIQVALVDLLASIGVYPDGLAGHSLGEVACAYADGCLTLEETILVAHARAAAIVTSKNPAGAMAAVGLTWKEALARCPPDIFPACHNAEDSVTISGPPDSVRSFVKQLQSEGVFAREVDSIGFAFHSKYIAASGPKLGETLNQIIRHPKPRSSKWISSSISERHWDSDVAKFASAAHFVNNLISPVLFYEAIQHIPANALVVELAPHCVLQAVMKRALPQSCTVLGLSHRTQPDNTAFFLNSVGKMRNAGLLPDVSKLYDGIEFPVSARASMISPLIQWDHSTSWDVASFKEVGRKRGAISIKISLANEEERRLYGGCAIDGSFIFPPSGYIYIVWKAFAELHGARYNQFPVVLEDLAFKRIQTLESTSSVTFQVSILPSTGKFEVLESNTVVASGIIRHLSPDETIQSEGFERKLLSAVTKASNRTAFTTNDVYGELKIRGYEYEGPFHGIYSMDSEFKWAEVTWKDNWVAFLDSLFQFESLGKCTRAVYLPARIQQLVLNPQALLEAVRVCKGQEGTLALAHSKCLNIIKCKGVEMRGLETRIIARTRDILRGMQNGLEKLKNPAPETLCKFYNVGLNIRDVRVAMGKEAPRTTLSKATFGVELVTPFGMEFAGETSAGQRIMGCAVSGALEMSLSLSEDSMLSWPVPTTWTLEEAVTVPYAYTVAYYALLVRGQLKPRESVLIHDSSGHVGRAALSIALSMNCRVFATVDSVAGQADLQRVYPPLSSGNFVILQDNSLEHHILEQTEGQGVNVILNSVTDKSALEATRCLAQHGRFLDVSQSEAVKDKRLGMAIFLKNISYHGIQLDALFDKKNEVDRRQVAKLVDEGIQCGVARPLSSRRVISMERLEEALRLVGEAGNHDKILLEVRTEKIDGTDNEVCDARYQDDLQVFVVPGNSGEENNNNEKDKSAAVKNCSSPSFSNLDVPSNNKGGNSYV